LRGLATIEVAPGLKNGDWLEKKGDSAHALSNLEEAQETTALGGETFRKKQFLMRG